jgi:hypothetical protein
MAGTVAGAHEARTGATYGEHGGQLTARRLAMGAYRQEGKALARRVVGADHVGAAGVGP